MKLVAQGYVKGGEGYVKLIPEEGKLQRSPLCAMLVVHGRAGCMPHACTERHVGPSPIGQHAPSMDGAHRSWAGEVVQANGSLHNRILNALLRRGCVLVNM